MRLDRRAIRTTAWITISRPALYLVSFTIFLLSGCVENSAPKVTAPAVAPTPAPPPPEPEKPLIFQQTVAYLPPQEPISRESLPPEEPLTVLPPPSQEDPQTPKPASKRPIVARAESPRSTPADRTTGTSAQAAPSSPANPSDSPEVQPAPAEEATKKVAIRPADDAGHSEEQIKKSIKQLQDTLTKIDQSKLNGDSRALYTRVSSFLKLSEQALARNDLRQADTLVSRAGVLAKEISSEK